METSPKRSEVTNSCSTRESKIFVCLPARKSKNSKKETVSAVVRRDSLRGNVNSGLRQHRFLGRGLQRLPIVAHKRVEVEANKLCRSSSILYSPAKSGMSLCEMDKVRPDAKNVVRNTDEFVISFVGMSVASHDAVTGLSKHKSDNELLLYSVKCATNSSLPNATIAEEETTQDELELSEKNVDDEGKAELIREKDPSSTAKHLENAEQLKVPTTFGANNDSVFIHYDPVADAHNTGTLADTFVNVPASKRAYACSKEVLREHKNNQEADDRLCLKKIPVKFTVMEIDKISDMQARAVMGVDHVGSFMSDTAGSIPYIALLTKAFAVGSSIGKHGLKSYSRPDHVLSADVEFCLANAPSDDDNEDGENDESVRTKKENYLRYGYYFFLSHKVPAKLYTMTNAVDDSLPLMMKRAEEGLSRRRGQHCRYFPLTEVSYVVMKVSRGCCSLSHEEIRKRSEGHKVRLENMLSISNALEVLAEAERKRQ